LAARDDVDVGAPVAGTFMAGLTDAERDALVGVGVMRTFARDAVLMFQDEPDDRVMVLRDGRVKVARIEQDGRELMLSIRDPGDLLGELAFIDGEPRVATVTALEPVRAVVIPALVMRRHLETTPRIAVLLLAIVARRFRESSVTRSQFGVTDTMGRLAARLVELAERYGEATDAGQVAVTLPISREDMAAWTGASRAGLAEALRRFRELGWLELEQRQLVVRDLDALRARAG
jgi:CRP-like cAMP-binding protein